MLNAPATAAAGATSAAAWFAPLVVRGLVGEDEAIAALVEAATRAATPTDTPAGKSADKPAHKRGAIAANGARCDERGRRVRLAHALSDAVADLARTRGAASARVARALAPLLAAWATPDTLHEAASAAAGGAFDPAELTAQVRAAARARLWRR